MNPCFGKEKTMAQSLPVKTTTSIWDEIDKMQNRIMERAYEIFRGNGSALGKDLDDWFQAERELLWKPVIDLEEKDNKFYLKVAIPGVDAKDLKIDVTVEDILIRAELKHEHKEDKGQVHQCEFASGNLFRSVHLPK